MKNILEDYKEVISKALNNNPGNAVAVFDADLNYVFANEATCKLLQKATHELEGKNLLELFPNLTASKSHRHLLQALSGEEVKNARSEGTFTREGAIYESTYFPLKDKDRVMAVLAVTKTVYYPEG